MRTTIKQVAMTAGVSVATVSRVLNNEPYVRIETRQKVEAAIALLAFRPSTAARALAGHRSFQIGLLYDNPSPYYIYNIQAGARDCCVGRGFRVLFQECDATSPKLVADIVGLLDEAHLDGVILSPPLSDSAPVLAELARRGLPFVRIAPGGDLRLSPYVHIDDEAAAARMIDHLAALGHRDIGFVIGHVDHVASQRRLRGFRRSMTRNGLAAHPEWMLQGNFTFDSGYDAGLAMLAPAHRPTAVFASNDDMAAGLLSAAHELGLAVPGEVAIAGFDDTDLARLVWPPLTTVRQPTRALAHAAARLLIDGAEGSPADGVGVQLDFEIIERGSTIAGPPHTALANR